MTNIFQGTFDLADFEHDELTLSTARMHVMVARWPQDVRDRVVDLLDAATLECAVRESVEYGAAADLLTLVRRIVRATEEHVEDYRAGGVDGDQA